MRTDFKIGLRRLIREKQYSLINVVGLAVSMAGALLIILFLQFELSYDRYHEDYQNKYRLATISNTGGDEIGLAVNSFPLAPLMESQFPEIKNSTRIFPLSFFFRNMVYRHGDRSFHESGVFAADSTFFDFFHFEFIYGNIQTALQEPFSIVMTKSMAERYFGHGDPTGVTLQVEGLGGVQVTAVVEDPPVNSHVQFEGLLSMSTLAHMRTLFESAFGPGASWAIFENNFLSRVCWVYLHTVDGFDPAVFMDTHWEGFYQEHLAEMEDMVQSSSSLKFQPLHTIHLQSKMEYEMTSETGAVTMMSPEMVGIFSVIALFLLLVASINYTNLAISRFHKRSKEVGVRKVMGADRHQLIKQFMAESVVTTMAALIIALVLVEIMLPSVNSLLGVAITTSVVSNPQILIFLLGIAVFVGLVAGVYPSVYFSSYSPVSVLTKRFSPGSGAMSLKKILIVVQFIISVFMVASTLVVNSQLRYINSKDLGYDYEHVMIIEMQDDVNVNRAGVLKNMLLQNPLVRDATVSNYFPSLYTIQNSLEIETEDGYQMFSLNYAQVSPDFKGFMEMEIVTGRFFDWDLRTDLGEAIVVNETAVRQFGWDDPIGKSIQANYLLSEYSGYDRRVVGVVRDFHYTSLTKPVEPLLMFPMEDRGNFLLVKVTDSDIPAAVSAIERAWNSFAPNNPLVYYFLDEAISGLYQSQQVLSTFFGAFALLCIIISFMGVYGLSAYAAEQRTREIGVRKVLGARLGDVIFMLNREFLWLLITAFVVATSLAWYFMGQWLDGFAYSTSLTMWPFLFAMFAASFITFLAVGYHAWRSMQRNPAETLQYE